MSKISDLAAAFQQTSQKELENTSEMVQNAIKQHEKNLIEQLQYANKNLAENIQIEQARLIKSTVKMYRLPTIIALSALIILILISSVLAWKAQETYQQMKEWQQSAEIAKEQAKGFLISLCQTDKGSKPCIAIDKDYMAKTWDGNYKIIQLHKGSK